MTRINMNMLRATVIAGALSIPMAATTSAQPPVVIGGGLVNVQIVDVVDDVTVTVQDINVAVGVAVQIAASVCDVSANVLAQQLKSGSATCDTLVDGTGQVVTINR